MWGKIEKPENLKLVDLNAREIATLVPLALLAFWIGLYPKPLFNILEQPVARIVQQVNHQWTGEAVARAGPAGVRR
jgi:NADH-quinone oxidoreductase subunit M